MNLYSKLGKFLLSGIVIAASFTMPLIMHASELNFSVSPNLPNNQVDKKHSYYDLKLKPGETQKVTTTLRNDTDEEIVVATEIARATTNTSGVVQYSSTKKDDIKSQLDSSYNIDITDLVSVPKEQIISPHSTIDVPIEIKMPKQAFKGVTAGGLTFKQTNLKPTDNDAQTNVVNQYAYTVGFVLQNSESTVNPDVKLDKIDAKQLNYRTAIMASLHNVTPTYINNISMDGFITEKNSDKKLYTVKNEVNDTNAGKQMAPNSIYELPFYLKGENLKPGQYILDLTMKSHDKVWHFKKEFTIAADEANKLNKTDVDHGQINWLLILGLLLLLLLLILIWIYLRLRRKRSEAK